MFHSSGLLVNITHHIFIAIFTSTNILLSKQYNSSTIHLNVSVS